MKIITDTNLPNLVPRPIFPLTHARRKNIGSGGIEFFLSCNWSLEKTKPETGSSHIAVDSQRKYSVQEHFVIEILTNGILTCKNCFLELANSGSLAWSDLIFEFKSVEISDPKRLLLLQIKLAEFSSKLLWILQVYE